MPLLSRHPPPHQVPRNPHRSSCRPRRLPVRLLSAPPPSRSHSHSTFLHGSRTIILLLNTLYRRRPTRQNLLPRSPSSAAQQRLRLLRYPNRHESAPPLKHSLPIRTTTRPVLPRSRPSDGSSQVRPDTPYTLIGFWRFAFEVLQRIVQDGSGVGRSGTENRQRWIWTSAPLS